MAGYIGNKSSVVSSGAERKFKFTITETTTTLSNLAYTPNLVHVFHNGIRLVDGTDYTATNGSSITLTNAAEDGDEVVVVSYASFQPSDTVSASLGGFFEGNITVNGDLTVDADTLFVDAATNEVGIGTTTAARSARLTVKAGNSTLGSGYSQLSVITSDAQAADVGGSIVLGGQSTAADWVYGSVSGRSENNSYAGYLAFGTSTSLGAHAERMRIDSSGNVGIGTSSPTVKLHVEGADNLSTRGRFVNSSSGTTLQLGARRDVSFVPYIGSESNHAFAFITNDTERMRIDSSGNLLVGKTDTTFSTAGFVLSNQFDVFQATRDQGNPVELNRTTSDGDIIKFYKDGTTVGSISSHGGGVDLGIGSGDVGLRFQGSSDAVFPFNTVSNSGRGDAIDLGLADNRFKDLYLSGGVFLGGTGGENLLDDYEEGTWTVQERNGQASITTNRANYTKIGRFVYASASIDVGSTSNTNTLNLTLPFASSITSYYVGGGNVSYTNLPSTYVDNIRPNIENAADNLFFFYGNGTADIKCNQASGYRIDFFAAYQV